MSKQVYTLRAFIKSFSQPNKKYPIKRNEEGELVCGCPDYIYRRKKNATVQDRMCKHLAKLAETTDNLEKLFLAGTKLVLEIEGDEWEVSKEYGANGAIQKSTVPLTDSPTNTEHI